MSLVAFIAGLIITGCGKTKSDQDLSEVEQDSNTVIQPVIITDTSLYDTDDPAIWINKNNPAESLVIGTDKGNDNGGIYVFTLDGHLDHSRTVLGLKRPNNVDIEYGFKYGDKEIDIAVCTERGRNMIRVFSLPDMKAIDGGGIPVFEEDSDKEPMGIALFKEPANGNIYAIVSRKKGPSGSYLWEYKLSSDAAGLVTGKVVRKFGAFSGVKEIEAVVVDDQLGYVYYSDETVGVRQYYASPDSANKELSLFANTGFSGDQEGISIYPTSETNGYIIVSDQTADQFHFYTREGSEGNPFMHKEIRVIKVTARESDGSDVTPIPLNDTFKKGLFVAMSNNRTFHFYRWEDIFKME